MENSKLISMTDFLLEQYSFDEQIYRYSLRNIVNYANFLKQPLELWMFVPCDEDGNVLSEKYSAKKDTENKSFAKLSNEYKQAEERVLFEGFHLLGVEDNIAEIELKNADLWITFIAKKAEVTNQFSQQYSVYTIEGLIQEDLTLTPTAIKQIYGKEKM